LAAMYAKKASESWSPAQSSSGGGGAGGGGAPRGAASGALALAFARDRVAIAYRIGGGGRPRCGETGEGGGQTDTRAGTDRGAATRFYPPFRFFEGAGACAGGPRLGKTAFGWGFTCKDKNVAFPHFLAA